MVFPKSSGSRWRGRAQVIFSIVAGNRGDRDREDNEKRNQLGEKPNFSERAFGQLVHNPNHGKGFY